MAVEHKAREKERRRKGGRASRREGGWEGEEERWLTLKYEPRCLSAYVLSCSLQSESRPAL
jgi:hypothetical protein